MPDAWVSHRDRVVVITGGGGGIGSASAVEMAQTGATVIAVDPGVGVTGEPRGERSAEETIARVQAAGGRGEASTASVTDLEALHELFADVRARYGRLDAVVNPAGILRYPPYAAATADDWSAVLGVHLDGYLNVLTAALPIMEDAGYGRIVGFTSGAGLARSSPDGPAYGTAKRAIASLTRELASHLPRGIAVNAMSPIAATRMVREALIAAGVDAGSGLDLTAMPQAEDMAPLASYLASEAIGWSRGNIIYSAGSEISAMGLPRILEAIRTDAADVEQALGTLVPVVMSAVEAAQRTTGGANPRFGQVFAPAVRTAGDPPGEEAPGCLVVAADATVGAQLAEAVSRWGLVPLGVGPAAPWEDAAAAVPASFEAAQELLDRACESRPVETIVISVRDRMAAGATSWSDVLAEHRTVTDRIMAHAAWARAAGVVAERTRRPLRIAFVTDALSTAGRSAAQATAQLARSINDTPGSSVLAYAVACESTERDDRAAMADLVARLLRADDTAELKGAELAVRAGWIAQQSHPAPLATASFGGPAIPIWVDTALREAFGA